MTDISDKKRIPLYRAGFFFYAAYIILALVYYRERSSFLDIPYHIFEMAHSGGPAIQNYRFVALLTQWAPLCALKMGLSLKAVMLIYSLVFALLYGCVYWLCGIMKQYQIGLAWLLTMTLFATHTFFWMQSELPQSMAVLFLSLAVLLWQPHTAAGPFIRTLLLLILLPTLAFGHPLLAAPFLAVLAMLWFFYKNRNQRLWIAATALVYVAAYLTRSVYFPTTYDSGAMDPLLRAGQNLPHLFSLPVTQFVMRKWIGAYALMPLSLAFLLWLYLRQKVTPWQWLILLIGFFGYLLIVILGDLNETTQPFYRENLLLPLGIFLSVPLVLYGLPFLLEKKWAVPFIWVVMIGCLARFVVVGFQYHERYLWLLAFIQEHRQEKLIITDKPEYVRALIMTWSTPYESWLVSTVQDGQTASLLIYENPQELEWATHNPQTFLTRWGAFPYKNLPARYFHFTDTITTYRIVP